MAIAGSEISLQSVTYIVVIGLGAGVFFSGLIRGAEIIGNSPVVQNVTQEAKEFLDNNIQGGAASVVAPASW